MQYPEDLQGQRFGRLLATHLHAEKTVAGRYQWMTHCDCGSRKLVAAMSLKNGETRSCGCLHSELLSARNRTHGASRTPEHRSWAAMLNRCTNSDGEDFHHYGGRGITVCEKWKQFSVFLEDMGTRPSLKHSIERLDVNGNYEPGNCIWATQKSQCRNRRHNHRVSIDGKKEHAADVAVRNGISAGTFYSRVAKLGWSISEAVRVPVRPRGVIGKDSSTWA